MFSRMFTPLFNITGISGWCTSCLFLAAIISIILGLIAAIMYLDYKWTKYYEIEKQLKQEEIDDKNNLP